MKPRPLSSSAFYENLSAYVGKSRRLQTCILGLDQLSNSDLCLAFPKPWVIWWSTHWGSNYVELNFSSPEKLNDNFVTHNLFYSYYKHSTQHLSLEKVKIEEFSLFLFRIAHFRSACKNLIIWFQNRSIILQKSQNSLFLLHYCEVANFEFDQNKTEEKKDAKNIFRRIVMWGEVKWKGNLLPGIAIGTSINDGSKSRKSKDNFREGIEVSVFS